MTTLPCSPKPASRPLYTAAVVLRSTTHGRWSYVRATLLRPVQRKADGVWTWRAEGPAPGAVDRRSRALATAEADTARLLLAVRGEVLHPGNPRTGAPAALAPRSDVCSAALTAERCA